MNEFGKKTIQIGHVLMIFEGSDKINDIPYLV